MAKSNIISGVDFVVTFFANDRMVSRLLSDILKNRDNDLFWGALGLPDDFVIPFYREDRNGNSVYILKVNA